MPMVCIGIMGVLVGKRFMPVPMRMFGPRQYRLVMLVLVMLVMPMFVFMLYAFMVSAG